MAWLAKSLSILIRKPIKQLLILNTKDFNKDSLIKQEIKTAIDKANESLASFEQIKKFQILSEEFQIGQELTPTLKVKRKFCTEKFKKEINKLYT